MKDRHVNADAEIVVVKGESGKAYSSADQRKIRALVRREVLLNTSEPYRKAQVEVRCRPDGSPESLVVTLMRAYTYSADLVTVRVDPEYKVQTVERPTAPAVHQV